jgi:DNA-binding CsgD family transcriptional regulator
MGKSKRLTQADVVLVMRLLSDLRELRHDQLAMHQMLVDRLAKMLGSTTGFGAGLKNVKPGAIPEIRSMTFAMQARDAVEELMTIMGWGGNGLADDPTVPPLIERSRPDAGGAFAFATEQPDLDDEARKFPIFGIARKQMRYTDHLIGWFSDDRSTHSMFGVGVHRLGGGEKPFSGKEVALAKLLFEELAWLQQTGRLTPPHPALDSLPPRLREIVHHLRAGLVPKEIASKLNLSVHTVRDHIKRIYDKLGVSDRAEFAAIFSRMSK